MKKKPQVKVTTKKPNLLRFLLDPQYINLTGPHDPKINRQLKKIIGRSS